MTTPAFAHHSTPHMTPRARRLLTHLYGLYAVAAFTRNTCAGCDTNRVRLSWSLHRLLDGPPTTPFRAATPLRRVIVLTTHNPATPPPTPPPHPHYPPTPHLRTHLARRILFYGYDTGSWFRRQHYHITLDGVAFHHTPNAVGCQA